jgi:hypothetical protein
MFLMPRSLLARSFASGEFDKNTVTSAAKDMQVGISALVEHLYNTSMIDEAARDRLRLLETSARRDVTAPKRHRRSTRR